MKNFAISITESASQNFKEILRNESLEDCDVYLRLWVSKGNCCSPFQYNLAIIQELPEENDIVIVDKDIQIIVDDISARYVNGATIEWDENAFGGGFKVINPNVTSCGCGSSFAAEGEETNGGCNGCSQNSR